MRCFRISDSSEASWELFSEDAIGFCHDQGLNIAHVLAGVRTVFVNTFGKELVNSHRVLAVVASCDGPVTFRKHNLIFLSSKGLFYCQHIYQFAHELCHFMVPGDVCKKYRWLEETLCEAMSWYALLSIAEQKEVPPIIELTTLYAGMSGYVLSAQQERAQIHTNHLSTFIANKQPYLQENCYDRPINAAIAYEIFPLFQEHPRLWNIVPFLHTLSDDMPLDSAIEALCRAANVIEAGGDQLIKRLTQ